MGRVVAFTAVFGPVDPPQVQPIDPDVPLICFTDHPRLTVPGYDIRSIDLPQLDPRRRARYVKVMAHVLFPDVEWAIWFDSTIRFKTGRVTEIVRAVDGASIAAHRHYVRSCVYDEASVCKQERLDDPAHIDAQMSRYRAHGYPVARGLWETGLIVRRLADPTIVRLNQCWWDEIVNGSVRDQVSLPVVLSRLGITVHDLADTVYDDAFAAKVHGPMTPSPRRGTGAAPSGRQCDPGMLFDEAFYVAANSGSMAKNIFGRPRYRRPLDHYLKIGWRHGRDPHPLFDVSYYLEANPDVASVGVEPLTHFLNSGARDGRDPHVLFDSTWYLREYGDAYRHEVGGALGHYLRVGWRLGMRPNQWFSPTRYTSRYADVAAAGVEPLQHYLRYGIGEGRDPRDLPH